MGSPIKPVLVTIERLVVGGIPLNKKSFFTYLVRRVLASIVVLFLVTIIIFVAVRMCPGDPVANKIGPYGDYSEENVARVTAELGLDKSYIEQYLIWLRNCLHGDLGVSLRNGAQITEIVMQKLAVSMELIVVSIVLALLIAIPLGILAGIHEGSMFDRFATTFTTSFLAIPSFCTGLFLIAFFSVRLGWLPSNGYVPFSENPIRNIQYLIMPAITLGLFVSASIFSFIRTDTQEVINSNFIRTAVAKGVPKRHIYFTHVLKNISVTIVTVTGIEFATLLGGTIIVEQLFGWSGMGWYICSSVSNRDYPAVQGSVLIVAVFFVVINMLMDILYAAIDPRIELT